MGTTLFSSCSFPAQISSVENGISRVKAVACSTGSDSVDGVMKRRSVLVSGASLISSAVLGFPADGLAVVKQGLLAGRVPGLSEPDEQG